MTTRLSCDIRNRFIDYFCKKHGHKYVKSSQVKPSKDNRDLSFTNSGMNQFKNLFLSQQTKFDLTRVCNYQKCIRVGGKFCDLDNVGRDFRHHTFFEMLGNWSFNDYGKNHACEWALDFLVNELNLVQNKCIVTYFSDESHCDGEARDIWLKLGLTKEQVIPKSGDENFWEMGNYGPCGLSTEIYYPCGRELIEIWNIVAIDRQRYPNNDTLVPLTNKFIDTGLGLERLLCILEGVESNYDTDLFRDLISVIERRPGVPKPYSGKLEDELDIGYRILVDHCRMIAIAITDGIEPGRKGAPFELRKIIKKVSILSKTHFNQETPRYLLFDLIDEVIKILSPAYPELSGSTRMIRRIIAHESIRYHKYLDKLQ